MFWTTQVQGENKKKDMEAMTACKKDDVLCRNWLIRFVNSQMLLKGTEARGHLIMSAAKVEHFLSWQVSEDL